jgi:hypothetical protein
MPKLRNVNPLGEVDVPILGRSLTAGEEFEVDDDTARLLLAQVGNYAPVGDAMDAMTVDELKALADEQGVDLTGLTKKADIVAAIKKGA